MQIQQRSLRNRILFSILTILFCIYLYKSTRYRPCPSQEDQTVLKYTSIPCPPNKYDSLYNKILQESLRISHEIWYMSRGAKDTQKFRSQLEDMSLQLEARLNVMGWTIGYEVTKRNQLNALADKLQKELTRLQNPADCVKARYITTHLPDCGFGCQAHHAALALHVAFTRNQTLFIYGNKWFDVFLPVTSCPIPGRHAIYQTILHKGFQLVSAAPPALRRDWANLLKDIHESPYAWFRGQLLRYILRLRPSPFKQKLEYDLRKIYTKPVVGIHIRRTDKISEAAPVSLTKYMEQVDRIHHRLQIEQELISSGNSISKEVVLTSDDKEVYEEARKNYPNYTFIGDHKKESDMSLRSTKKGLESIIYDVFTLANCDYVVCTFSSNICRLVFELILTDTRTYGDRTTHVQSLDAIYSMHGQIGRTWSAVGSTMGEEFKKGDRFEVIGNLWNGSLITSDGRFVPAYTLKEDIVLLPDN